MALRGQRMRRSACRKAASTRERSRRSAARCACASAVPRPAWPRWRASTASAVAWPSRASQIAHEHRLRAARLETRRASPWPWRRAPCRRELAQRGRRDDRADVEGFVQRALQPRAGEPLDQRDDGAARAPSARCGPTMLAAAASTLLGALPASRAACAAASVGSPCRLSSAPIATLTSLRRSRRRARAAARGRRWLPSDTAPRRASRRRAGWSPASSASICEAPEASFIDWRGEHRADLLAERAICPS